MGIAGNLETMELSELLQWLSQSKKTGTLHINDGAVEKQVAFQSGRIVSSASNDPNEYLGHFLVSHGFITETELSNAIQMQERTGMLLGKILVTIGAISEPDLNRLLRLKAEESIYSIFSWTEGAFRFADNELPQKNFIPLALDVTGLVLEGARRMDEWKRIREVIPSPQTVPVSMVEPLDDESLPAGERQVLRLVDDHSTIEEIALQTHSSEFHVCKVLFDQYRAKRVKLVRPRFLKEVVDPRAPVQAQGGSVGAASLVEEAERYLGEDDFEQTLRHLRAARSLEPESKEIQGRVQQGEQQLKTALEKEGVTVSAVPTLATNLQELTASKISPQEGFMLTRINGTYDIESIIKISPMPQLDALLVFWRLLKEGHILLNPPKR
jgi:hypothetical protein